MRIKSTLAALAGGIILFLSVATAQANTPAYTWEVTKIRGECQAIMRFEDIPDHFSRVRFYEKGSDYVLSEYHRIDGTDTFERKGYGARPAPPAYTYEVANRFEVIAHKVSYNLPIYRLTKEPEYIEAKWVNNPYVSAKAACDRGVSEEVLQDAKDWSADYKAHNEQALKDKKVEWENLHTATTLKRDALNEVAGWWSQALIDLMPLQEDIEAKEAEIATLEEDIRNLKAALAN